MYVNIQQKSIDIDFKKKSSFNFLTNYGFFQPLILSFYYWHILPMFIPSLLYITIVINEQNGFTYFLFIVYEQIWMNSYMVSP